MKNVDINIKYRAVAIYCAVHCCKNSGCNRVSWDELEQKFGISWESYTNELRVKGMLEAGIGWVRLRKEWVCMTLKERMERIKEWYPYPWQNKIITIKQ